MFQFISLVGDNCHSYLSFYACTPMDAEIGCFIYRKGGKEVCFRMKCNEGLKERKTTKHKNVQLRKNCATVCAKKENR